MSPETVSRLAFVKHLHTLAASQSRQPQPQCVAAVLSFHDAVELFLALVAEALDAGATRQTKFEDYFTLIEKKSGSPLQVRTAMLRLNTARVGLKHSGVPPSQDAIEAFRANVAEFFGANTPIFFDGTVYETLSQVDFVACVGAREHLQAAERLRTDDRLQALCAVRVAFGSLVHDYIERKRARWGATAFVVPEMTSASIRYHLGRENAHLESAFGSLSDEIRALQEALSIIGLGIDYRKFARFDGLVPPGARADKNGGYTFMRAPDDVSDDALEFALSFVIEAAMTLQQFDYSVQHPPGVRV